MLHRTLKGKIRTIDEGILGNTGPYIASRVGWGWDRMGSYTDDNFFISRFDKLGVCHLEHNFTFKTSALICCGDI
jgi:hypothetical protein